MNNDQPYSPPASEIPQELPPRPRKPWVAAILSLLGGPVGQVYAGAARRACVLWVLPFLMTPLVLLAMLYLPAGPMAFWLPLTCLLSYQVFIVVDAYREAVGNRDLPLKVYQRWWVYLLLVVGLAVVNPIAGTLVVVPTKHHVAEAFVTPTRGMADTILPGDRLYSARGRNRQGPFDLLVRRADRT